ncbi:hypothetical protein [Phenylobacterium sp.]|jgi:hypothetical protein|uniref:hypothetical protein n=1 Tax=Phenylobacterium sp. TaxID=1871053 RepID=UPI002F3F6E11
MLRRALIAAAPLVLLAAAAEASDKKEDKTPVGQYVDLSPVALPIVVRGQLVNYVFVYVRINLTNGANSVKLREKEPFFRDALVRAGHRTPFTRPDDYSVVDEAGLSAALTREAIQIAGPGAVKSVVVTSQSPKKRIIMPRPKSAA